LICRTSNRRNYLMESLLSTLSSADNRIGGIAILSKDGLVLACSGQQTLDEDILGAMGAALFAVGSKSVEKLLGSTIKHITVEGGQGQILLSLLSDGCLLVSVIQSESEEDSPALAPQIFATREKIANLLGS
ncbi:MAG: roadblock/LC7 domain-containing protein, partial [Methylovulum sp.]|nr:roadblock/LC7 domain-containing protein [Methylovulum sp.]